MSEPAKLTVIQDTTLQAMASNPRFVSEFPFLKSLASLPVTRKAGCGKCGGASNNVTANTYQSAKRALASMSPEKKSTLKRLLNTKSARVVFRNGNSVVELTF